MTCAPRTYRNENSGSVIVGMLHLISTALAAQFLEHFLICCRLPRLIHFRVFCGNGWDTNKTPVYTIFRKCSK